MKPTDFLVTAEDLLSGTSKPRQTNLRRACSSTYYALFHTLCDCCAGTLVGVKTKRAWAEAYRFLDHGPTKNKCNDQKVMKLFPPEIQDFANMFSAMQIKRHDADYDPTAFFYKSEVEADITAAKGAIIAFKNANLSDRRAFAAHIALSKKSR